jgi:hypothetical protein
VAEFVVARIGRDYVLEGSLVTRVVDDLGGHRRPRTKVDLG